MTISDSWQTTWLNQGVSLIEFVIMDTIASIDEFGCASHREWSGSSASANKFALLWGEAQLCLPYVCL